MEKKNTDWHCMMCVKFILGDCSGKEEKCSDYETLKDRMKW